MFNKMEIESLITYIWKDNQNALDVRSFVLNSENKGLIDHAAAIALIEALEERIAHNNNIMAICKKEIRLHLPTVRRNNLEPREPLTIEEEQAIISEYKKYFSV